MIITNSALFALHCIGHVHDGTSANKDFAAKKTTAPALGVNGS